MRLEQSLVLNRYLHSLFGASGLEDLKAALGRIDEGAGPDGQSRFFHTLAGLKGLQLPVDELGLPGNEDKIEGLKELGRLSDDEPFRRKKLTLEGYLLTDTPLDKIPGAERKSWQELEGSFKILRHGGDYVEKILKAG